MSVRAHRITELKWDSVEPFSLSDEKLVDFLNIQHQLDEDGCGIVDVSVEKLQSAVERAEELELDDDTVEAIKADIQQALDAGDEWIKYYLL